MTWRDISKIQNKYGGLQDYFESKGLQITMQAANLVLWLAGYV